MKFNKLMFAAIAFGALTMVACKKKNDPVGPTPTPGPEPEPEPELVIPEVADPGDGKVTFVVNVADYLVCEDGFSFKGSLDGSTWTAANEYLGENGPATAAECIKFEPIEDYDDWYKATFNLGATPFDEKECLLKGKICLIYPNDGDWQGQAVGLEIIDDYCTADVISEGDMFILSAGLVYVKVGGWQNSTCADQLSYTLTFKVPAFCSEEFDLEAVGSFEEGGWGHAPIPAEKVEDGIYSVSLVASAGASVKLRGVGAAADDWSKEIQSPDAEGVWGGLAFEGYTLTNDVNPSIDWSDPEKYRWATCAGEEPAEEGGDSAAE